MSLQIREFVRTDAPGVRAIFESNYPRYFADEDRDWLEEFFTAPDGPLFVILFQDRPVGFGGYELSRFYNRAVLTFGMVHGAYHKTSLGKLLLLYRIRHIHEQAKPQSGYVRVDTTPDIAGFFVHHGFELLATWPRGYRSGLDLCDLRFTIRPDRMTDLAAAVDRTLIAVGNRLDSRADR